LTPVEPAPQPDEGEAGGIGGTPGLDLTLLVQGELFAQKEIFCYQGSRWTQTQEQEARSITQKHQQNVHQRNRSGSENLPLAI
jgi:hypothetical protein